MPAAKRKPDRTSLYLLAGVALAVAVAVFVLRRRAGSVDVSGSPSVRRAVNEGEGGSGGATSIPGNLPPGLTFPPFVGPPDPNGGGDNSPGFVGGPADFDPHYTYTQPPLALPHGPVGDSPYTPYTPYQTAVTYAGANPGFAQEGSLLVGGLTRVSASPPKPPIVHPVGGGGQL